MQYKGNAATDTGTVKKVNQDSLTVKTAYSSWGMVALAVICDGLGGLEQGEVASASVVKAFDRWFKEVFPYRKESWDEESLKKDWESLLLSMNQELLEYGREAEVKLGTTVTAVLFLSDKYYAVHVGDCRMYELTGKCVQVTKDQTVVSHEIAAGRMTPEEAAVDARKNVLLQCVGVNEQLAPDFIVGDIKPETAYLLCSDGFRHKISESEIYGTLKPSANGSPEEMKKNLEYLIALDKERGERDNISAILIRADK